MNGNKSNNVRIGGGLGLVLLGLTIGILTFVTVVGPMLGLLLVGIGVFALGWAVRPRRVKTPSGRGK